MLPLVATALVISVAVAVMRRSSRRISVINSRLISQWQDDAAAFHKRSLAEVDYLCVDGIHLNTNGGRILAETVQQFLDS